MGPHVIIKCAPTNTMCENSAQQKCNTRKENGLQLGAINQRHIKQLQLLPIDEETNLLQLTNEEFEQQSLLDVIDNSIKELREQFGLFVITETEDNIYQYDDIYKLKLEAAEKYLFLLHQKQLHHNHRFANRSNIKRNSSSKN